MHLLSAMHMLSPEGICHTFDDRANGYGRGEGIGCLVIKRLSDALRDGDTIRAVIRGTGANADGKTPSITQPSSSAQAELIKRTYEAAGLSQEATQYFESHGTGTPVGVRAHHVIDATYILTKAVQDPIEMTAIGSTLGASRKAAGLGPLYVGSIKPTVGHTEGCSGLAGIFKAMVCLEKGLLAPTYGVEHINPRLKLDEWHLALPHQVMEWPERGQRRISINSFGFGGANAHVILDDAHHYLDQRGLVGNHGTTVLSDDDSDVGFSTPSSTPPYNSDPKQLFVFSTKDQAGIKRICAAYAHWLDQDSTSSREDTAFLRNLAYTLASRRSRLDYRTYAVAPNIGELREKVVKTLPILPRSLRQHDSLVFIFTGQGAQWPGMGRELLGNTVFRRSMETSQRCLQDLGCNWNAIIELQKTEDSQLHLPEYSQALCTILQVALVDLLRHWGITPKATVGHSSGEIAAAYAASMITQADAIKIAYTRGLSSAAIAQEGAMLAVGLSEEESQRYLNEVAAGSAVVACINSPSSITFSGDVDAIDKLETLISDAGKFARRLKVKTAYHSPHMREVSQSYLEQIGTLYPPEQGDNKTLMFSSLTGRLVKSCAELDAHYWVSNMQAPVQFSAAVIALLTYREDISKKMSVRWGGFVEVGPHAALQSPVQQIISANVNNSAKESPYLAILLRNKDAVETSLAAAGQLWAAGHTVDLQAVNGITAGSLKVLTDLPSYPWNHARGFWHESYMMRSNRYPSGPRTDLLGVAVDMQNKAEPRWRNQLRVDENPWIEDHKITDTVLYPAAGMLVMALEGALQMATVPSAIHGFRFRDVSFERALVVTSGEQAAVETQLSLLPHASLPGQFHFTIYSTTKGTSWTKHCSGTISLETRPAVSEVEDQSTEETTWAYHTALFKELNKNGEAVDVDNFYDHLEQIGMEYGPLFRNVVKLSTVPELRAATAEVVLPDTLSVMPAGYEFPHVIHPATMDSIFHMVLSVLNHGSPVAEAAVPYSIDDMFVAADQPHGAGSLFRGYGKVTRTSDGGHEVVADLVVSGEAFSGPKLTLKGFALRQVTSSQTSTAHRQVRDCAQIQWREDIDFIWSDAGLLQLGDATTSLLAAWLDRLTHKRAVGEVLVLIDREPSSNAAHALRDLCARVGSQPGIDKVSVAAPSATVLSSVCRLVPSPRIATYQWDFIGKEEPSSETGNYDTIIILDDRSGSSDLFIRLKDLMSAQGNLVIQQREEARTDIVLALQDAGFKSPITACCFHTARVASLPTAILPQEVYILLPTEPTEETSTLASALATALAGLNTTTHEIHLSNVSELAGKHVISLLEFSAPLIHSWTAPDFDAFKTLVSVAVYVFWLTRGDLLRAWTKDGTGTNFAPTQGLLRVLRNEYPLLTLPHLDMSPGLDLASSCRLLVDVWKRSLVSDAEMEYAVDKHGIVYIPRAVADDDFDVELEHGAAAVSGHLKPVKSKLSNMNVPMLPSETLHGSEYLWREDLAAREALGPLEVEVKVEAVGLRAHGGDQLPAALGHEAVGTVTRCGVQVNTVVVGQQVVVLRAQGALKTHVCQNESLIAQLPVGVKTEEAATITGVSIAAQYALLEIARLRRGQLVLIHSAAGAQGQAAIQIAQFIGADVFAMVSSKAEKQMLMEKYDIPSNRIYDSALRTFVAAINKATNQRGVDAIFCSKSCPAVLPSADILAEFGHFIGLGQSIAGVTLPTSLRNAVVASINVDQLQQANPDIVISLFRRTFDLLARSGNLKPASPSVSFSISDLPLALAALHDDPATPIAVSFTDANASVLTEPKLPPQLTLDSEGTYVLAGGLGSLGLDIAHMMAMHGAGHLVFLSRSGGSSKHHGALEALRSLEIRADAYSCDISNSSNVAAVFDKLRKAGCKIRGVLQAAMVLEDAIFANMTYDQWQRAFIPKTRGSRNLLDQLVLHSPEAKSKPFFILLSSITGVIGNAAQANYAAGNTFEDALAQYAREYLNIPATSIDVGAVIDSTNFTANGAFGDDIALLHRYSHGWRGLRTTLEALRTVLAALMRRAQNLESAPTTLVLGLGNELERHPGAMGFQQDHKFDLRVARGGQNDVESGGSESLALQLVRAGSVDEAAAVVEADLKTLVAAAIGVPANEVDVQKPLFDFGGECYNHYIIALLTLHS
jgi:acyl transferase domain-containing protein/NADPH:quinone reductase-like Zn-dependent oxidoreductase/NAD(P)-dependent dehydrogenase (short-subunit alcohol dehydrogenase family)